ncbi:MAG: hypothetical protein M3Z66_08465 [Chloroflexota bacterium]|nr:hypothetical protein [Chloroflexota bacterium]
MERRITRKLATICGVGLLTVAGLVGVASHTAVHAAGTPTTSQVSSQPAGADTANQQDVAGTDSSAAEASTESAVPEAGAEASGLDTDANAPCSGTNEATQTGNCDTQSQVDSQSNG